MGDYSIVEVEMMKWWGGWGWVLKNIGEILFFFYVSLVNVFLVFFFFFFGWEGGTKNSEFICKASNLRYVITSFVRILNSIVLSSYDLLTIL